MVVRNGMTLVVAGMAAGLVVAWTPGRVWTEWIGTSPALDIGTVAVSLGTLLIAGVVATLVPALRTAAIRPNLALRAD